METQALTSQIALVTLASFAIQRVIDLLDEALERLARRSVGDAASAQKLAQRKKTFSSGLGIVLGIAAAFIAKIALFKGGGYGDGGWPDMLVSGLVIGSGTEGVNTVIKYASYAKQQRGAVATAIEKHPELLVDPRTLRRL